MTADFQNSVLLHYLVKYEEYKILPNIICTVRIILFFARRIKLTNTQMTQAAFFCRYTGFVTCNDVYGVIIIHAYTAATQDAIIIVSSCYVIAAGASLSC